MNHHDPEDTMGTAEAAGKPRKKDDNPFVSLVLNVVIPTLVLKKLSAPGRLDPMSAMLIALAFPLGYGVFDFWRARRMNLIASLGFVSILLTGSLWLLKLDTTWFAVKEAAIPGLIAIAVLASMRSRNPLVKSLIYNENVIDVPRVDAELTAKGATGEFDRLLQSTTWILAGSFILSSVLNYALAIIVLKSPVGTDAFNDELGTMTGLSWPVIALPSTIVMFAGLWRLVHGIKRLTGLDLESIFKPHQRTAVAGAAATDSASGRRT